MSSPDRLPVVGEQCPRAVPPAWSLCGASAAEVRSQCGQAGVLRGGTHNTRVHTYPCSSACTYHAHAHRCVRTCPRAHLQAHACTHTEGWWQRSRGWSDVTTAKGLPHHRRREGAGPPSRPRAGRGLCSCGCSPGPAQLVAGCAAECTPSCGVPVCSGLPCGGPSVLVPACPSARSPAARARCARPAGGSFPGAAPVAACASSLGPHMCHARRWA